MCLPQGEKSDEISYGINLDIRLEYHIAAYNGISRDRKQMVNFQMAKISKLVCSICVLVPSSCSVRIINSTGRCSSYISK